MMSYLIVEGFAPADPVGITVPPGTPIGQLVKLDQTIDGRHLVLFAMLTRLSSGDLLLVGRSAKDLETLETALVETVAWGSAGTIAIGLVGAVFFGLGSLRQIEAITSSAEQIMRGDLSGRLPRRGLSADLGHLTSVVNGMLDQLERLMVEVKGVNENIAHDLRTPLTRVLASLERSLRNSKTAADFRTVDEDVVAEIKAIVVRFSALLRISELEDRLRRSGFATVDLIRVLDDAVDYYQPLAGEKAIQILWTPADRAVLVEGDASLLFEAASNRIDNAIKFSPEGSLISIGTMNDQAGFFVADRGRGIPEAEIDQVRARYQRGSARRSHTGFGIGLSLVESIARLHNMELHITDNAPGCRAEIRQTPMHAYSSVGYGRLDHAQSGLPRSPVSGR